ncbi:hypothetical protein BH23PLA1_BH23PLA1_21510 [soil metagenome]
MTTRRMALVMPLVLAAFFLINTRGMAQSGTVDRIEEDWELVIESPDVSAVGPQITTVMSPKTNNRQFFIAFNLNYRDYPNFQSGGLELLAYRNNAVIGSSTQHSTLCQTAGETITWTQEMRLTGGILTYRINDGQSTTWDKFGQGSGANLGISVATTATSLSDYSPNASVQRSGAGWQPNRVASMSLKKVRYYSGGQLVNEDDQVREVALTNAGPVGD